MPPAVQLMVVFDCGSTMILVVSTVCLHLPWLLLSLLSQVIMPDDEDVLFRNATSKPMNVILVSADVSPVSNLLRCSSITHAH